MPTNESIPADNPTLCKCVGKHIPKPSFYYLHFIYGDSGSYVWLCPTTLDNVRVLWDLYERTGERPSWDVLKSHSEYARYLVEQGRELRRKSYEKNEVSQPAKEGLA